MYKYEGKIDMVNWKHIQEFNKSKLYLLLLFIQLSALTLKSQTFAKPEHPQSYEVTTNILVNEVFEEQSKYTLHLIKTNEIDELFTIVIDSFIELNSFSFFRHDLLKSFQKDTIKIKVDKSNFKIQIQNIKYLSDKWMTNYCKSDQKLDRWCGRTKSGYKSCEDFVHYIIEQEFLFIIMPSIIKNSPKSIELTTEFSPDPLVYSVSYCCDSLITKTGLDANQESLKKYLDYQFNLHLQDLELRNEEELQEASNRYENWSLKKKRLVSKQQYIESVIRNQDNQYQKQLSYNLSELERMKKELINNKIELSYTLNSNGLYIDEIQYLNELNSIIFATPTELIRSTIKRRL